MSIENEIVDYDDNKEDIIKWVNLKGIFRYERIISFVKKKGIECNWANITNYIKYDKRILINSFKYIVFLEEYYKSMIYKHLNKNVDESNYCEFRKALTVYLEIKNDIAYDDMNINALRENKDSIIDFRNKVIHNKILLDNDFKGKSLEDILKIFIQILPKSYRDGFIKDINNCDKKLVGDKWHINLSNNSL